MAQKLNGDKDKDASSNADVAYYSFWKINIYLEHSHWIEATKSNSSQVVWKIS